MDADLPADVLALLRDRIGSLDELQVLLLLFDRAPQAWTLDAIAEAQRVPASIATEALQHLAAQDLISTRTEGDAPAYVFVPATTELARAVSALARLFRDQPIAVMKVMNEHALARVRVRAIHTFADAFVLQRKRDTDG